MFKNTLMALGILIAGQTQAASLLDTYGIQVVQGEAAFAIYNAIPGAQSPVRNLYGRDGYNSPKETIASVKEVAQLSCSKNGAGVSCFVSEKSGQNPVQINGSYISQKIYWLLETRTILMGDTSVKTVAQILCSQATATAEFSCNINFRQ